MRSFHELFFPNKFQIALIKFISFSSFHLAVARHSSHVGPQRSSNIRCDRQPSAHRVGFATRRFASINMSIKNSTMFSFGSLTADPPTTSSHQVTDRKPLCSNDSLLRAEHEVVAWFRLPSTRMLDSLTLYNDSARRRRQPELRNVLHALSGIYGRPGAAAEGQANVKNPAWVCYFRSASRGCCHVHLHLLIRFEQHQQEPVESLDERQREERQHRHVGKRVRRFMS